mmetsp:Transcript_11337/g.21485  ORF Transcript_11337/g.21485 Transcript_11337/m.21485 type:complete len:685 (+) Transcript_11337:25-2079(+)
MSFRQFLTVQAFKRLLGGHAAVTFAKWGLSRSVAQLALKVGVGRAATGVATAGLTTLTVRDQLKERRPSSRGGDVLAAQDELAWVNAAIKPLWDHLDAGLKRVIVDELEPALQRSVPVVGRFLHFTKLTLGSAAPRLGPVSVLYADDGKSVNLNVGFEFDGDLAIEFSAMGGTIEVLDLAIKGAVQVSLRPLVDALNPVGGITISCLDRPSLDLRIRSGFTDRLPNLYDFVRETVDNVIASVIVVPNGIAVPINTVGGPKTDEAELACPEPQGLLRLTVREVWEEVDPEADAGSQESASDSEEEEAGKEDKLQQQEVYAQVLLGAARWHTPPARAVSSTAPRRARWAEGSTQDFVVFSDRQALEIRVFQEDAWKLHDCIGQARVAVGQVVEGSDVEVPLIAHSDGKTRGRMRLQGEWLAVSEKPPGWLPAPAATRPRKLSKASTSPALTAPAGHGDADVLLSARVDGLQGLKPNAAYKYTVCVGAADYEQCSRFGSPLQSEMDSCSDELFIALVKKLSPRLTLADLADTLGISAAHAREFVEHESKLQRTASSGSGGQEGRGLEPAAAAERWELAWCGRAREAARSLAASENPQFQQILHVPTPGARNLHMRLLCHSDGSSKERTVAEFTHSLADIAAAGGKLNGPFRMQLDNGRECELHGSVRLRQLETIDPIAEDMARNRHA